MTIIVLGSRTYQPIADIDRELLEIKPGNPTVMAFGSSDVCRRAVVAATSLGLDARNVTLSSHRRELIDASKQPDTAVWLFCARDANGSGLTEGITQIGSFLVAQGIAPRMIESPLSGRVCATITELRQSVDRALETKQERRRAILTERTLKLATAAIEDRDRFAQKLETGLHLYPDDETATERWLLWERCYRALHDAIDDARSVLATRNAVAA